MVFQSMLLAAVATLHLKSTSTLTWLMYLGLATCIVWLHMNILTWLAEKHIWIRLVECDPRIKALSDIRTGLGSISWLMAYPLPILLGVTWVVLLIQGIR